MFTFRLIRTSQRQEPTIVTDRVHFHLNLIFPAGKQVVTLMGITGSVGLVCSG
jgi:hypothetical protein